MTTCIDTHVGMHLHANECPTQTEMEALLKNFPQVIQKQSLALKILSACLPAKAMLFSLDAFYLHHLSNL